MVGRFYHLANKIKEQFSLQGGQLDIIVHVMYIVQCGVQFSITACPVSPKGIQCRYLIN